MSNIYIIVIVTVFVIQAIVVIATPLRIGAFNLHIFGPSKASENETVSIISRIVRRYDIVLLQEIRDVSETLIHDLLTVVNREEPVYSYKIVVGPRLGNSVSKEQYAYVYRNETVEISDNYTYADPENVFEREPLVVLVRDLTVKPVSEVVLIGIHVRPDSAQAEINALVTVYDEAVLRYNTSNVILLGDMNADCSFLSNVRYDNLTFTNDDRFLWLIDKESDTTTSNSNCAYDRFVVTRSVSNTLVPASVVIFLFDQEYGLTQAQALEVSDHYPIELQLEGLNVTSTLTLSSTTMASLTASTSVMPMGGSSSVDSNCSDGSVAVITGVIAGIVIGLLIMIIVGLIIGGLAYKHISTNRSGMLKIKPIT